MANMTFSGGFLLGAGLMYLRGAARTPASRGLQCIAGALGVAAVAYGTKLVAQHRRKTTSTSTALDIDMPDYAWLR
jgi:hypothetical protein